MFGSKEDAAGRAASNLGDANREFGMLPRGTRSQTPKTHLVHPAKCAEMEKQAEHSLTFYLSKN